MNPIIDYLSTLIKYTPDPRYYPRALLYLIKAAAWEPFRHAERAAERWRDEPRRLPHAPVFIVGYYRSGTTHLQETMLQDPTFGYMNFYQGFFPTAFSSTERWIKPVFERIVRRAGMLHPAHGVSFSFEMPAEEDVAMVASGFRLAANWAQMFPRSFKEIYAKTGLMEGISEAELEAFRRELHHLLWRVSKANDHRRLLLKSPPQLARLSMLRDMYPGAKFVFIRRNPYDAFASNKKLWKSFELTSLQDVDAESVRENILWSYDRCHAAYERDKVALEDGQLCEVTFEAFRAQPLRTLRHIYDTLELGEFERAEPLFASYLQRTHQSSQPSYLLTEEERGAVQHRLSRWLGEWGYEPRHARAA